jgi:3-hydroxybutyryl-CoA dehydratase
MTHMVVAQGDTARFSKTVAESDVYMFAGITGDFYGAHVDEEMMKATTYGRRIAHGALLVGFMSTTSTMIIHQAAARGERSTPVALGFDRIRFIAPVFFGDTIVVTYAVTEVDSDRRRSTAEIEIRNQRGEIVCVATHLIKWLVPK